MSAADQVSLSPLITDSLLPKCSSCGVLLQNEDNSRPGYYSERKNPAPFVKSEDAVFNLHLRLLPEEDRLLLLNGADSSVPDFTTELAKKRKPRHDTNNTKPQCVRCRDALYRSQFQPDQYKVDTVSQVMESIPPHANVVYVVSAVDFPMSLKESVFQYRLAKSMQFVVTKNDLMFGRKDMALKYGLQFYQDYLWRTHQVPPENVFCVSGAIDWHTDKLFLAIRDNLYFIGCVNSGKSTLILSLLHVAEKHKQTLPNAKRDRMLQKATDSAISYGSRPTTRQALIKHNLAAMREFKKVNGPGTSYMPGFTRGNLPFELTRNVTIYDVPGFASSQASQLYEFMEPEAIKSLHKGQKLHKAGTYKSHYETVKGGQVATVGGLFFLQVPANSMLQVRNMINHKFHSFKDMDKALDVWKNNAKHPALRQAFVVDSEKTSLVKHIIPSFYGNVDLVIQSVGYISIKPTGKFASADPFVVYLPKGLEAIVRQPITKYITRTLAGRDGQGNTLKKENWVEKSVTEVKRYSGKSPFFTRLIPVTENTNLDDAQVMHKYVKHMKGHAVPHNEISEPTKYANWI